MVFDHLIPPAEPVHAPFDLARFHPALAAWLVRSGLAFFAHQADALDLVLRGKNVVVSTTTASGKSLCYILPVINALLASNATTSSLLVFPLKALAQDQHAKIQALLVQVGLPASLVGVYDADASAEQKRAMRATAKIIITNPYGLHHYLGNVYLWREFFGHLGHVVFDEIHVYTGVFGSNIAFVTRRLQRVARAFGRDPSWILCSATIGNPLEHATRLTGLPFSLVDNDGSARAAKRVVFWNPVLVEATGQRISSHHDTRELFKAFVSRGLQTLVFTQSRKLAELHARWAADALGQAGRAGQVLPYRAGYPAKTRRAIEKRLREKDLIGIAATSALELGIDVGTLDAVIVSGFPGSITSFWQQGGRCGRSGKEGTVVLVAGADALDQYYMAHPEAFMGSKHEDAIIDLTNRYIVRGHVECAIKELALDPSEMEWFGPAARDAVAGLVSAGIAMEANGRYVHATNGFPAEKVPLNSIPSETYTVHDVSSGAKRYLTSESEHRVFAELHEGAIYLFMAETYKVVDLDIHSKTVTVAREDVDYYTESMRDTWIRPVRFVDGVYERIARASDTTPVSRTERAGGLESFDVYFGDVLVESQCTRYVKRTIATGEIAGVHDLDLPKTSFYTKAMWFNVPLDVQVALDAGGTRMLGGAIHAVEHGTISLFPKRVLCSRWDIGGVSIDIDPLYKKPMIYIYDGFPGGIGLAERAKDLAITMLADARTMIAACPCKVDTGCPSCIQSPKCGNGNEPLSKKGALLFLDEVLGTITSSACPAPSIASPSRSSPARPTRSSSGQAGS